MQIDPPGPLVSALKGVRAQLDRLDRAAERIASTAPTGELESDLVEMIAIEHGITANVKVARSADRALGTLLDILA